MTGALGGAVLAHLMFELPAVTASTHQRTGGGLWLGEVVGHRRPDRPDLRPGPHRPRFAGIAPASAPGFIAAQLAGAALGLALIRLMYPSPIPQPTTGPEHLTAGPATTART